ncbi:MAG: HK97 gp10 family phage protein [Myxococcales bacterium]|nr:HK97 gp10 family phage protein [Myxococcales bacterium]
MGIRLELDIDALKESVAGVEQELAQTIPLALKLGGDMVAVHARQNHDYKDQTGQLTNSIEAGEVSGSFEAGNLEITVSAGAPYGLAVEEGTAPHVIRPRHRKALRWPVAGGANGFAFAKSVNHPGTQGTFFLKKAGEAKLEAVAGVLEDAAGLAFARQGFR